MKRNSPRYRNLNRKVPDHLKNFAIVTLRDGSLPTVSLPGTENWYWYINQKEFSALEQNPNACAEIGYELMWLVPIEQE
jgi:hypothetical protein